MKLPPDIADAVVKEAAKQIADRVFTEAAELQLISIETAAEILGTSIPTARALIREHVELGERCRRVRLSTVRKVIAERTVQR